MQRPVYVNNVLDSDISVDGAKRYDHKNEITHQYKTRDEENIWRLIQI